MIFCRLSNAHVVLLLGRSHQPLYHHLFSPGTPSSFTVFLAGVGWGKPASLNLRFWRTFQAVRQAITGQMKDFDRTLQQLMVRTQ
jgi:hypothetical protein